MVRRTSPEGARVRAKGHDITEVAWTWHILPAWQHTSCEWVGICDDILLEPHVVPTEQCKSFAL